MTKVSVSILDCDFENLDFEIDRINKSISDYIHLDIMDGSFVKIIKQTFYNENKK